METSNALPVRTCYREFLVDLVFRRLRCYVWNILGMIICQAKSAYDRFCMGR